MSIQMLNTIWSLSSRDAQLSNSCIILGSRDQNNYFLPGDNALCFNKFRSIITNSFENI